MTAIIKTHRSTHVCSSGCACRSWRCHECGTSELMDRQTRYEAEQPGPGQYGVELCDGCGAPICDQCVMDGDHQCEPDPAEDQKHYTPEDLEADSFGPGQPEDHEGWKHYTPEDLEADSFGDG